MNSTLMKLIDVTREFSTKYSTVSVLKGINMEIGRGELVVLTGASGVGKSTLLNLMGGLDRPTSGIIEYEGKDLTKPECGLESYRNRDVGFVFQFHHLLPEFSAEENVAMPLLIRREKSHIAFDKARGILSEVGLAHRFNHKPGELSGGEQQRVALARAIITNPALILADEPTGNLDEDTAKLVFDLICQLNKELGVTFVVATHNVSLAMSADRWLQIRDGAVNIAEESVSGFNEF